MGTMDFDTGEGFPSQLPVSGKVDLVATAFHELAHSLGIGASIGYLPDDEEDRRIAIADYAAKNVARWAGWNSGATVGGGYRWALTQNVHIGPLAALSYTHLARPGITETGASATRLKLGSNSFDSLRASLGVVSGVDVALNGAQHFRADLQVTWDHELLDLAAKTNARFADYPRARLTSRNAIGSRDSLGLRAGMTYYVQKNVSVGASVSSQFLRSGQRSVTGDVASIGDSESVITP